MYERLANSNATHFSRVSANDFLVLCYCVVIYKYFFLYDQHQLYCGYFYNKGVAYNHVELIFFVNGSQVEQRISGIRGIVYPVVYGKL